MAWINNQDGGRDIFLSSKIGNCSIEVQTHRYYKRVNRDTQLPCQKRTRTVYGQNWSFDRSDRHRRIDLAVLPIFLRRLNLSANAKSHLTLATPECLPSCPNRNSLITSFSNEIESCLLNEVWNSKFSEIYRKYMKIYYHIIIFFSFRS